MVRMPGRFTAAWMIVATVMVTGAISGCATNTPRTTPVASGVTRVDLGSVTVTMLSDGQGARPLDANFVRNVPLAEVQAALTEAKLPTDRIDVPFNPFVADIGAQRVLFDTGSGEFGAAGSGKLLENMGKAGIDPKSVTAVVISHFHGDQGILADGQIGNAPARGFCRVGVHVEDDGPVGIAHEQEDVCRVCPIEQFARSAFDHECGVPRGMPVGGD